MSSLPSNFQPARILVIKLRHLGDVLLMTPLYQALAEHFAGAQVHAGVNAGTEEILRDNPWVRGVMAVPRRVKNRSGFGNFAAQVKFLFDVRRASFDLVLDLTGTDRSAILAGLSGAPQRWGYARKKGFFGRNHLFTRTVRRKAGVHVVQQQAAFLEAFGIPTRALALSFPIADRHRARVAELIDRGSSWVHVHPVSRVMEKCWPAPFLAEFLDRLAALGFRPVLTASPDPAERAWIADLRTRMTTPALDLSGQLNLQELGALSESARLFVGVDSAPMHIAAAVGTPVIGIFGPSSETLWGPWCERKLILSRELPCRLPCKNKRACPHIECLRAMTPEMVMEPTIEFLQSLGEPAR